MFGLLKKSKPLQDDVYFPFKTVVEKKQLVSDKRQFASNEFDFVQKQRKRQNMSNDEKWVRSGDRPFTKAKRSNYDILDQKELQTYASLEKMLHKAIHAIRQLKKKGNTNTSPAPKQQSNFSSLSNSDLKTNEISFDKSKAVKPTSKAHSTRCFKCHRIGHYANKCQKQKPLVTLENENLETEQEKEESLPVHKPDQTQGEQCSDYGSFAYNPFPFNVSDLRTNLFEEGENDAPQSMDQYMEPSEESVHGLKPAEVRVDDLDELSELIDTSLELNELSDTEDGAGLVAGRNGPFSAHGKIHNKFNLGPFYTKFDQAFADGLLPICIKKYQQKESKSWSGQGAFNKTLISSQKS